MTENKNSSWFQKWWGQMLIIMGVIGLIIFFVWGIYLFDTISSPQPVISNNSEESDSNLVVLNKLNDFGDPYVGDKDAPIQIYEFSDFGCPYCKQAYPVIKEVLDLYSDQVRWIYKDFPIDKYHPNASKAAEAAQCANEQGKFVEMHDILFNNQTNLSDIAIKKYAAKISLDASLFKQCFETRKYKNEVETDLREGFSLGVEGTPTWFINGYRVSGVISTEKMVQLIEQILTSQNSQ